MRYIDSTVIIRQVNNEYLSVGVRIPEKVLNGTINDPDTRPIRQLCVDNCPIAERVDIAQILTNFSMGTNQQQSLYVAAEKVCKDTLVTDFFFDSCVFDFLMTGQSLFSGMARNAYEDVKKYSSRQPRWSNRTHIAQYTTAASSIEGQQPLPKNISSGAQATAGSRLLRTLLFVYIMLITSLCL